MADLTARLREAVAKAEGYTQDDDWLVTIRLRRDGYVVDAQREVGDKVLRKSRAVSWVQMERAMHNSLAMTVDEVVAELST